MSRTSSLAALVSAAALLVPAPATANSRDERVEKLITALPQIARLDAGRVIYVLRGDLSAKKSAKAERIASLVVADLNRRLRLHPPGGDILTVDVCLFASHPTYSRFDQSLYGPSGGPSPLGYYEPKWDLVVADLTKGMGNLRHELVHPLLGADFPGLPSWLNEGFGSLYGSARVKGSGDLHFLVNYRLRDLQRALERGALPSLDQVVASSRSEVYGDDAMVYYALARYLLLYLDRHETLGDFYRTVRAAEGRPAEVLAALRAAIDYPAFERWARGLRYPAQRR